jgi:2-polyprenyl-6-methoxyphenol hydroxylase-like FAD-dependent oxidoreductase
VDNQDRVIATFQDGTQATGDLLIGCDGVHSRTRQYVDPTFPGATYTGLMNAGGYTSSLKLAPTTETFHFIFGRQAFFGYHVSSSGEISWFVNYTQEEEPVRDATAKQTVDEQRQRLLTLFRDEQPLMRNIIQGAETIFPDFPTYILPKQPAWHRGPVGLIGDAAHAISSSSGQGASMALEDAAMLAKCLRDIPEIEQAFATFEQLRRERTQKMLDLGLRGDAGKHVVGPVQAWWRDLMTSFFLNLFATPKAVNWMYDYKVDWDAPLMGGSTFAGSVKEPAAEPDVIRQ